MVRYISNVSSEGRIKRHKLPKRSSEKMRKVPLFLILVLIFALMSIQRTQNKPKPNEDSLPVIEVNTTVPTDREFNDVIDNAFSEKLGVEFFDTATYLANRYLANDMQAQYYAMKLISKGELYSEEELKLINSLDDADRVAKAIEHVHNLILEKKP